MMLTEELKIVHKEFRAYLRTKEAKKGNMLNNLINAAEIKLPALIRAHFNPDFQCLYEDIHPIEELLFYSRKIKSDENILAGPFGYICSKAIDGYIRYYADKNGINLDDYDTIAEEDGEDYSEEPEFVEGEVSDSCSKRYERNPKARKECIAAKGCICSICGFDFGKEYGEWGEGFIQVHHIIPIHERGGSYKLNPIRDLIPICSNCHSMIHRKRSETLKPDELRDKYLKQHQ